MSQLKNTSKTKILAFADLSKKATNVLSTGNAIAEKMKASLKVIHVKPPLSVIKQDNQFSAKKELFQDYRTTQSQLEALINKYAPGADYEVVYGNVKNNVLDAIANIDPQIIVLGKRSKKLGGIVGDRITDTVVNRNTTASVLIVDIEQPIPGSEQLALGVLKGKGNAELGVLGTVLAENSAQTRYFSIEEDMDSPVSHEGNHYIFSKGANALDNLVNYTSKTNTHLFCIPKGMEGRFPRKMLHKLKANVLLVR